MSQIRDLLYRAIKELDYIHEIHGTEYDSSVVSHEGKEIIEEGMRLLGCKDLSAEELHSDENQLTLASVYGEITIK